MGIELQEKVPQNSSQVDHLCAYFTLNRFRREKGLRATHVYTCIPHTTTTRLVPYAHVVIQSRLHLLRPRPSQHEGYQRLDMRPWVPVGKGVALSQIGADQRTFQNYPIGSCDGRCIQRAGT